MARALIVGCGCRGRELGRSLLAAGWQVRGTTRSRERLAAIEAAGVEAALADPDRIATVLESIGDVTLVFWLLGAAEGGPEALAALHGPRLERLLAEIVDTPVRGFVYESGGPLPAYERERGRAIVRAAAERWRIPVEIVTADPAGHDRWREAMVGAAQRLTG